tara:strand:+ start:2008 stop:2709 length:702 start_codon:yes stop_codon:yes gene_type:complete
MTRSPQKVAERFIAEEAAKALRKEWCLGPDRENPDFIVTEGGKQFGLEIVEIFTGPQDGHGSHRKRAESETQKVVNALRTEYEEKDDTPLFVKFVGDMCRENLEAVIPTLRELNLSARLPGDQERFVVDKGPAKLSVYVTRGIHNADWYCVNDRVGGVDQNPAERITEAINSKAGRLPRYRECAGLDDIRLLIVANRRMNSGKLRLEERPELDLRGFDVVYFYSFPENVTVFR